MGKLDSHRDKQQHEQPQITFISICLDKGLVWHSKQPCNFTGPLWVRLFQQHYAPIPPADSHPAVPQMGTGVLEMKDALWELSAAAETADQWGSLYQHLHLYSVVAMAVVVVMVLQRIWWQFHLQWWGQWIAQKSSHAYRRMLNILTVCWNITVAYEDNRFWYKHSCLTISSKWQFMKINKTRSDLHRMAHIQLMLLMATLVCTDLLLFNKTYFHAFPNHFRSW